MLCVHKALKIQTFLKENIFKYPHKIILIVLKTDILRTCHIFDIESVLKKAIVKHQYLSDLASIVAYNVFQHFHNHQLDILNVLIPLNLKHNTIY